MLRRVVLAFAAPIAPAHHQLIVVFVFRFDFSTNSDKFQGEERENRNDMTGK